MAISTEERSFFVAMGERIAALRKVLSSKRGPVPQWQQQNEAVVLLPKSQQQFVSKMIETVLAQAGAR
jgi:hypothetical protein